MITIIHTHAEGTLVEGTSRGDGSNTVLKAHRFRWSRSLGCWYLPQSRDTDAQRSIIDPAVEALRAAGHEVSVEVDESMRRSFAEAEAGQAARAEARADRYGSRSQRAAANSEAAGSRADEMAEHLPLGQPSLTGHHSERRHRRYLDRMHTLTGTAVAEHKRAQYWDARAEAAGRYEEFRNSVSTTLRRIQKLEAEQRRVQRETAEATKVGAAEVYREKLARRTAELDEGLAYWQGVIAEAEAAGVKVWSRADFVKGDFVRYSGHWFQVLRVNAKTLSVPPIVSDGHIIRAEGNRLSWTNTLPYDEVRGRASAEQIAALLAETDAATTG